MSGLGVWVRFEDDYLHSENAITEMIFAYEKFNTIFSKDLVLLPSDYPYLYAKDEATKIYLKQSISYMRRHFSTQDNGLHRHRLKILTRTLRKRLRFR